MSGYYPLSNETAKVSQTPDQEETKCPQQTITPLEHDDGPTTPSQHSEGHATPSPRSVPFQRFYFRSLIGLLAPLIITGYYVYIYITYLHPISLQSDTDMKVGTGAPQRTFYAWFIIATIGMNLSKYGLVGIEASALMRRGWAPRNAAILMVHAEHTWSGPSGWGKEGWKVLKNIVSSRRRRQKRESERGLLFAGRLWWVLAFLSVLSFIALALSGLTMELATGYRASNEHAVVLGYNLTNFSERSGLSESVHTRSFELWKNAVPNGVPGLGVVYTAPGVDRKLSGNDGLVEFPNVLSENDDLDDVFLPAQADVPLSGKIWGLRVSYNCSVARGLSDFVVFRERNKWSSVKPSSANESDKSIANMMREYGYDATGKRLVDHPYCSLPNNLCTMSNQTDGAMPGEKLVRDFANLQAVREVAVSSPLGTENWLYAGDDTNELYSVTEHLEYILWQVVVEKSPLREWDNVGKVNTEIVNPIPELEGIWYSTPTVEIPEPVPMQAIGVKCDSSSGLGYAQVDGRTSTFSKFTPARPQLVEVDEGTSNAVRRQTGLKRLAFGAYFLLTQMSAFGSKAFSGQVLKQDWLRGVFTAGRSPQGVTVQYELDSGFRAIQKQALDADGLKRALLAAHGRYALTVMYDNWPGRVSSFLNESSGAETTHLDSETSAPMYISKDTTAYLPDQKILEPGPLPATFPLVLLGIWTLSTTLLSFMFAFRRRWSETLDSFSMFRFGVGMHAGGEVKEDDLQVEGADECTVLESQPGMVGGKRGRVGLVWRG